MAFWILGLLGSLGTLGVAKLNGYRLEAINSGSMSPSIPKNSLAAVAPTSTWDIGRGDVIAFRLPSNRRIDVLHRVVTTSRSADGIFFETKGDANNAPDPMFVPDDDVRGRLVWHAPFIGAVVRALRPPTGYVVLVGTPLLVLIGSSLARRLRRDRRKEVRPLMHGEPTLGDPFEMQLIGA